MSAPERLYGLLPAIYRIRDAERGEPLRALLGILEEQLELLEGDVGGLYDDHFIETCEEWVVPYIGDLLGVRLLHNVESGGLVSQRALVANTLSFRRRKGTLSMLEDLARDVTGWRAKAVAFFELLGWSQNLNHLRFDFTPNPDPREPDRLNPPAADRVGTVNLRHLDAVDRLDGPFDVLAHTVDVRPLGQLEGWHNIRKLGLFLWRLGSYPMPGVEPRPSELAAAGSPPSSPPAVGAGFHFSPLGHPAPLFTNPERKADEKGLATEHNVPGPIRPVAFSGRTADYYGSESDKSLALYEGPEVDPARLIPVEDVLCRDLSAWSPPPVGKVAVDVALGRFAFHPDDPRAAGELAATYHYGFSADLGGGPYDRRATLETADADDWAVTVAEVEPDPPPAEWRSTLADALASWDPALNPRAVITFADNRTYDEELAIELSAGQHLVIQADDRNRPTLRLRDAAGDPSVLAVKAGAGSPPGSSGASPPAGGPWSLTLSGLLIEGGVHVEAVGDPLETEVEGRLELRHSTLVPGLALDESGEPIAPAAPSLQVDLADAGLEVVIDSCVTGSLRLPAEVISLAVRDSIVDRPRGEASPDAARVALAADDAGDEPGPPTTLERVTVLGEVRVKTLTLASEVIFTHRVIAQRRQAGCVRYSYVDDRVSITPRRFRCQPDLALATRRKKLGVAALPAAEAAVIRSRLRPRFTTTRYGLPGYAQLRRTTAEEIRTGSEDGAEMGAFERLKQPQREANLAIRLDEYLPYGLEAGGIYVT